MDYATLGILLALSFLPPLAFALWARNHERHQREPLRTVLGLFAYGGTLGVAIALLLSVVFDAGFHDTPVAAVGLIGLVVVAPVVEELAKGLGLGLARGRVLELEDGIIYGAAIGLGFGATENLLYGLAALQEDGLADAVATISFRVPSSVLLHASSTALLGYGYAWARLRGAPMAAVLPFYLLAVVQHALYNLLVGPQVLLGFAAAVAMVLLVAGALRRRIRHLDRQPSWQRVA